MPWKTALYGELGNTLSGRRWDGGSGRRGNTAPLRCGRWGNERRRVWWSPNITCSLTNSCWMTKSSFPLIPLLPSILVISSGVQKSVGKLLQHWEDQQLNHLQLLPCHIFRVLFPVNLGPPGSISLGQGRVTTSDFHTCCRDHRTGR